VITVTAVSSIKLRQSALFSAGSLFNSGMKAGPCHEDVDAIMRGFYSHLAMLPPSDIPAEQPPKTEHPPRRVLFINDTSRNGGPGKTLLDIVKFLDPARIHRTVLVPWPGIVSQRLLENNAADHLFFEPGLIEHIFAPLSRPVERGDLAAAWPLKILRACGNVVRAMVGVIRLSRKIQRERYDVIFCNGTMANICGGLLAALTGTPTLWHVLYTSVGGAAGKLHARLAAGKSVKAIICVSRPTARQFPQCPEKIRLIHDAIDIDEFDAGQGTNTCKGAGALRQELGLQADAVIFGSHGRILPRKGYVEMIHAARRVLDRLSAGDRARCHFVIIGDTPQDMKIDHLEECRALVRQFGLEAQVHFIGFRPAVIAYVGDFDVAVVPSIYQDPLPLAVLESMAMAKPVVAFDVGGMGEMITDGVSGRLAPGSPPDVGALAEACLNYFADAALRQRHGAAGRARIEQDFNARSHAQRIEDELVRAAL
jgi:glycosyltransferase involved in cell wall biosynthesis